MKLKFKENRGITLIALVITIVVLLILAGISLNLVLGQNGIIAKAKDAKSETERDKGATETAVNSLYDEMVGHLDGESEAVDGKAIHPIDGVGKFEITGTIDGKVASASNPTIPSQYTPVNTKDAKWDAEGGPEYNKGLVIIDDNGNEWVWVPVVDASVMYETSETAIALSGDTGVNTTKYSKSEIISGITRAQPGYVAESHITMKSQEPDLVLRADNNSNAQTAGFNDLSDMATKLVSDYETMIRSIETYHGFYVGRYELTTNGEKAGATLTNKNWYQLYANCKNLAASDKAITRMIWGCQWDATCNWLASCGYDIMDSSSWGNYKDSTGNAAVTVEYGTKQNTGYSEYWKANNIYDFAGNCSEWTQEGGHGYDYNLGFIYGRNYRGGDYYTEGSNHAVSSLGGFGNWGYASDVDRGSPNYTGYNYVSSRPTLIINIM